VKPFEHRDPPFTYSTSHGLGDRVRRAQKLSGVLWGAFVVLAVLSSIPLMAMIGNEIRHEELTDGSVIDRRDYILVGKLVWVPEENARWMRSLLVCLILTVGMLMAAGAAARANASHVRVAGYGGAARIGGR
jgi:hypothetical protein